MALGHLQGKTWDYSGECYEHGGFHQYWKQNGFTIKVITTTIRKEQDTIIQKN